jgi:hypothetical protein
MFMKNSRERRGEIADVCLELEPRRCERSEAIHETTRSKSGLLRCARNDGLVSARTHSSGVTGGGQMV